MKSEVKQNKEFAHWLGEWITRTQQTRDRIEQLAYEPKGVEEQSALSGADGNR